VSTLTGVHSVRHILNEKSETKCDPYAGREGVGIDDGKGRRAVGWSCARRTGPAGSASAEDADSKGWAIEGCIRGIRHGIRRMTRESASGATRGRSSPSVPTIPLYPTAPVGSEHLCGSGDVPLSASDRISSPAIRGIIHGWSATYAGFPTASAKSIQDVGPVEHGGLLTGYRNTGNSRKVAAIPPMPSTGPAREIGETSPARAIDYRSFHASDTRGVRPATVPGIGVLRSLAWWPKSPVPCLVVRRLAPRPAMIRNHP
jgi:hypothetical protein